MSSRKGLPPGLKVGFETQAPPPVVRPPGLPNARPPADAKLELLAPHETATRARGGHGIASRSIKRSSANAPRASRGSGTSATAATAAPAARKTTGKHKAAKLDDGSARRRRAPGGGGASLGVVGLMVALPIIALFGVGMMIVVNKNTAAPATTAPAATPAPAVSRPATPAPAPAAKPADADEASAEPATGETSERSRRPSADAADEDAMSEDDAKLAREARRLSLEAERKMIEEREAKANGGAPAPAPGE